MDLEVGQGAVQTGWSYGASERRLRLSHKLELLFIRGFGYLALRHGLQNRHSTCLIEMWSLVVYRCVLSRRGFEAFTSVRFGELRYGKLVSSR